MRTLLTASFLAMPALAQIPTDAVLVLEQTNTISAPNYRLVDARGGGTWVATNQSVFLQPSPVSVAVDPLAADTFWFEAATTSFAGTWRAQFGALGALGLSAWGGWFQSAGQRIEVGSTRVFRIANGVVDACGRLQGAAAPAPLFALPGAVDLAVQGARLYVATGSGPLVEYDTTTTQQRTVGSYSGVTALAASPVVPELCLGLQNGDLLRVDIATGAVLTTTPTGLGAIVALGYTRFGTLVWADATQLWSELVPTAPVYTAATAIRDFGVAAVPTASSVPFGAGCGAATAARWTVSGAPTLGSAGFQLGLAAAPGSTLALLALGQSRFFATQLGVPLPFDLGLLGAANCRLLADPAVALAYVTSPGGNAAQTLPIPNQPALAGLEFVGQWFIADATVGPLGIAGTAGLAFVPR